MEDWKERLKAEYAQTKERYEKLKAWNNKRTVASELAYHTPCTSDADAAERRKQQYHEAVIPTIHLIGLKSTIPDQCGFRLLIPDKYRDLRFGDQNPPDQKRQERFTHRKPVSADRRCHLRNQGAQSDRTVPAAAAALPPAAEQPVFTYDHPAPAASACCFAG